jgi:tetratricopeptide (TPR) repeat protein
VTNPIFVQADRLSTQAKRCSARGEHEEAIRLQQVAVEAYREIYHQRTRDPVDSEIDGRERNEVAYRLTDHYGRLGGMYRRAGQLKPALDSYTRGAELETEWQLDDTYNRTNKIIFALLLDPRSLPALIDEIEKTADLVRSQINRTRRDQWWAWADMGLLSLLAGRPRDARWAYDHFAATGARRGDYDSTMSVLRELEAALSAHAPERSQELAAAIAHLETSRGT